MPQPPAKHPDRSSISCAIPGPIVRDEAYASIRSSVGNVVRWPSKVVRSKSRFDLGRSPPNLENTAVRAQRLTCNLDDRRFCRYEFAEQSLERCGIIAAQRRPRARTATDRAAFDR